MEKIHVIGITGGVYKASEVDFEMNELHAKHYEELGGLRERVAELQDSNDALQAKLTAVTIDLEQKLHFMQASSDHFERTSGATSDRERLTSFQLRAAMERVAELEGEKHWRCYYCGEVCKTEHEARNHFGSSLGAETACQIKVAGEWALLEALRNAEDQLGRYRSEDSEVLRAMASMQSDHQKAMRGEEEAGYGRGVADMRERERLLLEAVRWLHGLTETLSDDGKTYLLQSSTATSRACWLEIPAHLDPLIAEAVEKKP